MAKWTKFQEAGCHQVRFERFQAAAFKEQKGWDQSAAVTCAGKQKEAQRRIMLFHWSLPRSNLQTCRRQHQGNSHRCLLLFFFFFLPTHFQWGSLFFISFLSVMIKPLQAASSRLEEKIQKSSRQERPAIAEVWWQFRTLPGSPWCILSASVRGFSPHCNLVGVTSAGNNMQKVGGRLIGASSVTALIKLSAAPGRIKGEPEISSHISIHISPGPSPANTQC